MPGDGMASIDVLLERELKESRDREADYRARLSRHRDLASKLRAHATLLRSALHGQVLTPGAIRKLLADVARLSSQALGIPRTSIWLFDDARENLVCRFQLVGGKEASVEGLRLAVSKCPAYVRALTHNEIGAVAVNDTWQDPRTIELGDYCETYDVGALLDIPVLGPGQLYGVVCHEHLGGPRVWQEEEIDFATDVGAMVALALESERRITAEHTARGTEAKYRHLVESLPVTVYSFHAKTGDLEYLSPRIYDLGGWTPEQFLASGGLARWIEAIEPEDREPVLRRLSNGLAEGLTEELIYRVRLPDGTRRWVRDTCAAVRDATGRPVAVQGTLADITALKQAELARMEIERRHQTLLENVDLLAMTLDSAGRILFVNECFERITGFNRSEALGADGFALMAPEHERDRIRGDFLKSLGRGTIAPRFEYTIRTRTGAQRRILWTNTVMRAFGGDVLGTSSLGIDLTERLEVEARELEEQKLESLGRLAATVAHDFNNLLTIIASAGQTLTGALAGSTDAERVAVVRELNLAVEQATGLTKSLLTYARREEIAPTILSVDALVRGAEPLLHKLAAREVRLSLALAVPQAEVVIDASQLRQVLFNLVSNAVEATRGHGTQVRVSTNLVVLESDEARARGLVSEGTFLVLTVADDGRGMDHELQMHVFEPFFTTKPQGEGTGLGLAICGSIIRRAGGFISMESEIGKGTVFRVHLPVARSRGPRSNDGRAPVAAGPESTGPSRGTVLLVEDNEPVRNLVTRVLSSEGVHVLEAPGIAEARAQLAAGAVDVLLTDGRLPDGHGLDLAKEVARQGLARSIVLMSGDSPEDSPAEVTVVLPKPFRPEVLVDTILRMLADTSGPTTGTA